MKKIRVGIIGCGKIFDKHLKALYSIIIGFIFAASTIWNTSLSFLQSFAWIIGAVISFIIYYLLSSK